MHRIGCISWNVVHLRCIANLTSYLELTAFLPLEAGQFFVGVQPSLEQHDDELRKMMPLIIRAETPTDLDAIR